MSYTFLPHSPQHPAQYWAQRGDSKTSTSCVKFQGQVPIHNSILSIRDLQEGLLPLKCHVLALESLTKLVSVLGALILTCLWDFTKYSEISSWERECLGGNASGQRVPSAAITQLALSPGACPQLLSASVGRREEHLQ